MPTTFSVKTSTRASFQRGAAAGGGGRLLHPGEQGLLLAPERVRPRVPAGRIARIARPRRPRPRRPRPRRDGLGGGVEGGDLRGFLGFAVLVGVLGALVVRIRRGREPAGARMERIQSLPVAARVGAIGGSALRSRRATAPGGRRPLPLPSHRLPVPRERDGERLDGRQQLLLQAHHQQGGGGPGARRAGLQPLLPQAAVLVQEARENELRRVFRQSVDHDTPHLPFRKAAPDLADILLDAPHHHFFEGAPSPDRNAPGEAVGVEELEQGGEAVGVAVVGRGGQEQAVLETPPEIADRAGELRLDPVTPAARRGGVVGLVQDQEAPRPQAAQPLAHGVRVARIDEQVVGHEEAAVGAPRVDPEAPLPADPREVRTVEDHEEEAEALLHLRLPLLQHGGGRRDDDLLRLLAEQQLARDEPGLDGLAEAGVVGDEEVDAGHPERLAERLHLVGVDLDAGAERRLEEVRIGGGDAVPAKGVEERAEMAGRVEAPGADGAPRLPIEDAAVDLEVPVDLQRLPLGVVVGAREADPGRRGRVAGVLLDRLHEPAPRAHLDQLADARGACGQQVGGLAQGRPRYDGYGWVSRCRLPASWGASVTLRPFRPRCILSGRHAAQRPRRPPPPWRPGAANRSGPTRPASSGKQFVRVEPPWSSRQADSHARLE